jgi:FixJ family two-component response regulator
MTRGRISIVDDDESVRESLPDLLLEHGYSVMAFASAEHFLASDKLDETDCLILDVVMPGMTGPELQRVLSTRAPLLPLIFITAIDDASLRQRLLQIGAVDLLLKPFGDIVLRTAIERALKHR